MVLIFLSNSPPESEQAYLLPFKSLILTHALRSCAGLREQYNTVFNYYLLLIFFH